MSHAARLLAQGSAGEKSLVEETYDMYAKGYDTSKTWPTTFTTSRTALGFADDITWHFLRKYAPRNKSARILEAGAGTGTWALRFVKLGYRNLVLADLSQGMLNEAKQKFRRLRKKITVRFVKCDIAHMKEFQANTFEYVFSQYDAVTLSLRPKQAVKELARVAKKRAYVVACLDVKYRRVPELIQAGQMEKAQELLKTGISYDSIHPQSNLTWQELASYFQAAGLNVVEVIGAPVFMHQVGEKLAEKLYKNRLLRRKLLKMELENCTNRSLVNFSGHLQMVGRKPRSP